MRLGPCLLLGLGLLGCAAGDGSAAVRPRPLPSGVAADPRHWPAAGVTSAVPNPSCRRVPSPPRPGPRRTSSTSPSLWPPLALLLPGLLAAAAAVAVLRGIGGTAPWRMAGHVGLGPPDGRPDVLLFGNTRTVPLLPPLPAAAVHRYTVVFEVDAALVFATDRWTPQGASAGVVRLTLRPGSPRLYTIVRPHAPELLAALAPHCELVMWTMGTREYADAVAHHVDPRRGFHHIIHSDWSWYRRSDPVKELRRLGRPPGRTLIVDTDAAVCRANPSHAVLLDPFLGDSRDATLPALRRLLAGLLASGLPVPEYLAQCRQRGDLVVHTDGHYHFRTVYRPDPPKSTDADLCVDLISIDPM